jgi:hypothetical protein
MDLPRASVTRWLVILVTGVGLVAMHSLMSVPGPRRASTDASVASSGRHAAPPSSPDDPMGGHPMGGQSIGDGPMGDGPMAGHPMGGHLMGGQSMGDGPMVAPGQPPGHDHHHGSMLGHLCLAVLAALGLVLLAPVLARTLRRRPVAPVRPAGPDPASSDARAPPTTPTRLAQLCVSRR